MTRFGGRIRGAFVIGLSCVFVLLGQRVMQFREARKTREALAPLHQRSRPLTPAYEAALQRHVERLAHSLPCESAKPTSLSELTQALQALGPVEIQAAHLLEPKPDSAPRSPQSPEVYLELQAPASLLPLFLETLALKSYIPKTLELKALEGSQLQLQAHLFWVPQSFFPERPKSLTPSPSSPTIKSSTMSDNIIQLSKSTFDDTIKSGVALVDFWAPWCGPCKAIAPIIEEVADAMQGKASVCKIVVDDNPEVAAKYNVQAIPTLIIFKDGQELSRSVGPSTKAELLDSLQKAISG